MQQASGKVIDISSVKSALWVNWLPLLWLEKLSAVRSKPPKCWEWHGKAASLPVHRLPTGQFLTPTPFLQHLLYVTVTDAVWFLTRLVDDLYILLTLHRGHQSSEDDKMKVQQHNKHIFLTVTSCCSLSAEVFELFQYSFSSTSFDSQQQSKTIQL